MCIHLETCFLAFTWNRDCLSASSDEQIRVKCILFLHLAIMFNTVEPKTFRFNCHECGFDLLQYDFAYYSFQVMLTTMMSSVILATDGIGHIAFGTYLTLTEQRVGKKSVGESQYILLIS